MDITEFKEFYTKIFVANGLERFCKEDTIQCFYQFAHILIETNRHMNLTAIREMPDVIAKHFADCLLAEEYFPQDATVLDVGCGGGFPTFPLAIARHDLKIVAMDSTQKKISFVQGTADSLGLKNIKAICARAEDDSMRSMRETFDVVTSRATANLQVLLEIAFSYVKVGGQMVALKGARGLDELRDASNAIHILGGGTAKDAHCELYTADGTVEARYLLLIDKASQTPKQYPRQYSAIAKKPL